MSKIKINYLGDLRTSSEHLDSNTVITTDAPKDNQGLGRKFSPTDLVASSLGSCLLTIMGIVAKRHNIHLDKGVIYSASPSPFINHIEINYGVFTKSKVTISVYNIEGEIVANLDERILEPQKYSVSWNPHSNLPKGHYFIAIIINDLQVHYRKIIRK